MSDKQKIDDGGPAFPMSEVIYGVDKSQENYERELKGMSMRDYFAAAAMTGIWANLSGKANFSGTDIGDIANVAYDQADAMLKVRS